MSAPFTVVATANHGSLTTPTFPVAAASPTAPSHVIARMVSPVFGADPTLTFELKVWRSFDGGVNWEPTPYFAPGVMQGGQAGTPTKSGGVFDGLYSCGVSYEGVAFTGKVEVTCSASFVWGLTAQVI